MLVFFYGFVCSSIWEFNDLKETIVYEGFSWQLIHVGGYVVLVGQIRLEEADGRQIHFSESFCEHMLCTKHHANF